MTAPPRPFVKRRQRLIKTRFQLRLVAIFAGIALLAQGFQTVLMAAHLTNLAAEMPSGGVYLADRTPSMLLEVLLASTFMLLPMILLVGISATFRIAGPLYRFGVFLKDVRDGSQVELCRLRKGDQLQDLCEIINGATAEQRERNAENLAARAGDQSEAA